MRRLQRFPIGRWLLGGLLSILLVDTGLRLIETTPLWRVLPVVEPILGEPDADIGFELTPGASGVWPIEHRARVHIDALGLRDIDRTVAKPAGSVRIGLLGDSMTEAFQVSQPATYAALTEHALQARGQRVEVINLAMAGPNPIRPLLRLEKRGYALGLDLAVVNASADSFTAGLLLDDRENPAYVEGSSGALVRGYGFRRRLSQRYAGSMGERTFIWLYQHSPLFRMSYLRSKEPWRESLGLSSANVPARLGQSSGVDRAETCHAVEVSLEPHVRLWRDHQPARYWAATTQFLDDFAAGTRAHAIRALYAMRDIALTPSDCRVAAQERAELVAIMDGEFARRGMQFVDWNETVAAISGDDLARLHGFGSHRGAGHLNYDGHRAWAAALTSILRTKLPSL
ncbi:MAG: hypothetical protein ACLPX7_20685 [Xanthobacteraceae bacterium]